MINKKFFLFVTMFFLKKHISKNIFFTISCQLLEKHINKNSTRAPILDIYSPQFYLNENVRINTTFMIGTIQKVLYLNYPFTYSNDNPSNQMKNTNTSGLVILKDQPNWVSAANLSSQKNIEPIAYFTLQEIPIGWQILSPVDYYNRSAMPTKLSFYNNNIYIGKVVGPQEIMNNKLPRMQNYNDHGLFVNTYYNNLLNFYIANNANYKSNQQITEEKKVVACSSSVDTTEGDLMEETLDIENSRRLDLSINIQNLIQSGGNNNIVIGSHSGTFQDSRYISFNTILGTRSGNQLSGSCNTFIGNFNGSNSEIDTIILNKDYYSSNLQSNYNNAIGFGNFNLTTSDTTYATGKLVAAKQNNIFGNFNLYSMRNAFKNVVIGNANLSTIIDNITQFNWIDSNILIGNKILYKTDTQPIAGMYGNIMLIPNGDELAYGGIGVSNALSGIDNGYWTICNNAIFIGSCGLPIPYERSYHTFISNIYNSSLFYNTFIVEGALQKRNVHGLTSLPVVTLVNNADQLGQMELLPYGNPNPDPVFDTTCPTSPTAQKSSYYKCQPGNIFNIDNAVNCLLDPAITPIIGIAFDNTDIAASNGLFYTIDVYSILQNQTDITQYNPLSAFLIYNIIQELPPYENPNNISGESYAIYNSPAIIGYEHYYLIPLIIKAVQQINAKINNLQDTLIAKNTNIENESFEDTMESAISPLQEKIYFMYEAYQKLLSVVDAQDKKIAQLENLLTQQMSPIKE